MAGSCATGLMSHGASAGTDLGRRGLRRMNCHGRSGRVPRFDNRRNGHGWGSGVHKAADCYPGRRRWYRGDRYRFGLWWSGKRHHCGVTRVWLHRRANRGDRPTAGGDARSAARNFNGPDFASFGIGIRAFLGQRLP
jgi:hypothetical protein